MTRILVVEDDEQISLALQHGFEYEGYAVSLATDGEAAIRQFDRIRPDLVILDLMLPRRSGLEVCDELRQRPESVPIIMLSARGQEIDKIRGLRAGADDYVTKPFSFLELLARVEAVLRRSSPGEEGELDRELVIGALVVDVPRCEAMRDGEPVEISPRELDLLCYFARHPDRVLTREQLLHSVWGYDQAPRTRTVDMHIAKLRKKVEPEPTHPRVLLTVHGRGYRYRPGRRSGAPRPRG